MERARVLHRKGKKIGKNVFEQLSCKNRSFFGANIMQGSGISKIFHTYITFSEKMSLSPPPSPL